VTDSPDPDHSAESPEAAEVRRLLADARHTEPMPDDVVARMDDVLTGLRDAPASTTAATSAGHADTTPAARRDSVVPLAAHRRRRAAGLLVAAAAIVVGGVAVAQNLPQSGSSSDSTAEGSAGNSGADAPRSRTSANAHEPPTVAGGDLRASDDGRLVVHPQRFSVDALAGLRLLRHTPARTTNAPDSLDACVSVPARAGQVLQVTYQHAPAALVYHSASGGSQVVDLYVCGSHRPVRSATLPAR
jgi:hypothetical protein